MMIAHPSHPWAREPGVTVVEFLTKTGDVMKANFSSTMTYQQMLDHKRELDKACAVPAPKPYNGSLKLRLAVHLILMRARANV